MRLASRPTIDRMALMAQRAQRVWDPRIHLPALSLAAYAAWLLLAPPFTAQDLLGSLGVVAARAGAAFALLAVARRRQPQRIWSHLGVGACPLLCVSNVREMIE